MSKPNTAVATPFRAMSTGSPNGAPPTVSTATRHGIEMNALPNIVTACNFVAPAAARGPPTCLANNDARPTSAPARPAGSRIITP